MLRYSDFGPALVVPYSTSMLTVAGAVYVVWAGPVSLIHACALAAPLLNTADISTISESSHLQAAAGRR